jgi:spore germination protein
MDIYVVQPGDDINSIAYKYGVSATKLIQDNGLENLSTVVPGQSIVILYPTQTHIVQEGDSLTTISNAYGVTIMQLLRNNPFLLDREYIYPGESIVVSYNINGKVTTNGYAYYYINRDTLKKTLPYLTYLSIFNYRIPTEGGIITYGDESDIIQLAKEYGVAPLMMITSLSTLGESNIEAVYNLIINEERQDSIINNILNILRSKSYYGLNWMSNSINVYNQKIYINFLTKLSNALNNEGYLLFITLNPNVKYVDNEISLEQIDYSSIGKVVDGITFLQFVWGINFEPPAPISSANLLRNFIDYLVQLVPPEKIIIGKPLIAYDWELPYVPGISRGNSLTLNSAIALANDVGATIEFDESSKSPFFKYSQSNLVAKIEHIVWFIDARSINSLDKLIAEYGLEGTGIWSIMIYFQQLWSIINSQYEIVKVIPDNL